LISTKRALLAAAFKRGRPISATSIKTCAELTLTENHYKVDYNHYMEFEMAMQWPNLYPHPCYLQMVALPLQLQLLTHEKSPFKAVGLVHLHNKIIQTPAFKLGQPFDLKVKFGDVMSHPKGIVAEVILEAVQADQVVYTAVCSFLQRTNTSNSGKLTEPSHLPYTENQISKANRYLTDLVFRNSAGRRYASLSGDYNPIHLSAWSAKILGFKRAIAHGMNSLALVISREEAALKFKPSDAPVVVCCDFLKPVFLPSKTKIYTGGSGCDRFVKLCNADNETIEHLVVCYTRGEASRLYRRF
jgi:hypothetical protein